MDRFSYHKDQKAEIITIKERAITLKLSDADMERIFKKAGAAGLTVPELLQNFIGDLVDGTYSNGSDERDYAQRWFDRCWFGMFPEHTFTQYLIQSDQFDVVVGLWNDIQTAKEDLADTLEHPDEYGADEVSAFKEDIADWEKDIHGIFAAFKSNAAENKIGTLEQEMELVIRWKASLEKALA